MRNFILSCKKEAFFIPLQKPKFTNDWKQALYFDYLVVGVQTEMTGIRCILLYTNDIISKSVNFKSKKNNFTIYTLFFMSHWKVPTYSKLQFVLRCEKN